MPKPAAHFVFPVSSRKPQEERVSRCFGLVRKAANVDYDFFIRSRPDIEFVYPITWPLPAPGSPLHAEVYAPISHGNTAAYPWSDLITGGMLVSGVVKSFIIAHHGKTCPNKGPNKEHLLSVDAHDPCVDITDQIAAVAARVAPFYFKFPLANFSSVDFDVHTRPRPHDPTLLNFRCSGWWVRFPAEGRLNYRLRNGGATVAPWDFGFILAPSRKKNMGHCSNKFSGSLESCLGGEELKLTREARLEAILARNVAITCYPGKPNAALPELVDRWSRLMFNLTEPELGASLNSSADFSSNPISDAGGDLEDSGLREDDFGKFDWGR